MKPIEKRVEALLSRCVPRAVQCMQGPTWPSTRLPGLSRSTSDVHAWVIDVPARGLHVGGLKQFEDRRAKTGVGGPPPMRNRRG